MAMSDHKRIWLEPEPPSDPDFGRMWVQDDVWGGGTEYVLASATADTITRLTRERDEARAKAIEDAAKVAETFFLGFDAKDKDVNGLRRRNQHWFDAAAAAIRKLGEQP
jgi:hypothetical protein